MVWKLLKRLLVLLLRPGMSFLHLSLSRAMSCFFGCLGIRNRYRFSRSNNLSDSSISKPKVPVSQNQLESLLLSEENQGSSIKDVDTTYFHSPAEVKELNNEAKFLKICGTITETPAEIRKASQKSHGSLFDKDLEHLKCHSWFPLSNETLQLDCSKQNSPWQPASSKKAYESPCANATETDIHCRSKSVRFESQFNESSPEILFPDKVSRNGMKSHYNASGSKQSPYPTPLKLSDEMQTPGTVYPSNFVNIMNGKTQIRSQFVRSVIDPVDGNSEHLVVEDDDNFDGLSAESKGSLIESENASLKSEVLGKETTEGLNGTSEKFETFSDRNKCERTPGDSKLWDGNGIPNSTNKCKEDQKLSWLATPFEQRLEKALSCSPRIFHGKSSFSDEDSDTVLSEMQPETRPNTVISF